MSTNQTNSVPPVVGDDPGGMIDKLLQMSEELLQQDVVSQAEGRGLNRDKCSSIGLFSFLV